MWKDLVVRDRVKNGMGWNGACRFDHGLGLLAWLLPSEARGWGKLAEHLPPHATAAGREGLAPLPRLPTPTMLHMHRNHKEIDQPASPIFLIS